MMDAWKPAARRGLLVVVVVVALATPGARAGNLVAGADGGATQIAAESVSRLVSSEGPAKNVAAVTSAGPTVPWPRRSRVLDAALATDFGAREAPPASDAATVVGRSVEVGGRRAVVLDCQPAPSREVETAAFMAGCAQVVVLHAWRSDLGRCVAATANACRALRDACKAGSRRVGLVVAAHDAHEGVTPPVSGSGAPSLVQLALADVKAACDGDASFLTFFAVADADEPAAVAARVAECLNDAKCVAPAADVGGRVAAAWLEARSPVSRADTARFACDAAADRARSRVDAAVARWKRDVDDARLAPKGWAAEAAEVHRDALVRYDAATVAYWRDGPTRAATRAALEAAVFDDIRKAHRKQLDTASAKRLRQLRRRLEKACAADPRGELDAANADALVADAEFDFDLDATRCCVPSLDLLAGDARLKFRDAAKRLAADFPETPAAQVLAAKAEERAAKRNAPKSKIADVDRPKQPPKPKKPLARRRRPNRHQL